MLIKLQQTLIDLFDWVFASKSSRSNAVVIIRNREEQEQRQRELNKMYEKW